MEGKTGPDYEGPEIHVRLVQLAGSCRLRGTLADDELIFPYFLFVIFPHESSCASYINN